MIYNTVLKNYLTKLQIAYNESEIDSLSEKVCNLYFKYPTILYTHSQLININSTSCHWYHKIPDIVECALYSDDISTEDFEKLINNKYMQWDLNEVTLKKCMDFLAWRPFNEKCAMLMKTVFSSRLTDMHYQFFTKRFVSKHGDIEQLADMVDPEIYENLCNARGNDIDLTIEPEDSDMTYKEILTYYLQHGEIKYNQDDLNALNEDSCRVLLVQTDNMINEKTGEFDFFKSTNDNQHPELFRFLLFDENTPLESFKEMVHDVQDMKWEDLLFRVLNIQSPELVIDKIMYFVNSYITDTTRAATVLNDLFNEHVHDKVRQKVIEKLDESVVESIQKTDRYQHEDRIQTFF